MARAKRKRVPQPSRKGDWQLWFANSQVEADWEQFCASARNAAHNAYVAIASDPRRHTSRQARLHGDLATWKKDNRTSLEQWQYEATGAARIWYAIEDDKKSLWMTLASIGHPKRTE